MGAAGRAEHRMRLTADAYARDDLMWLEDSRVIPPRLERRYLDAAEAIAAVSDARMRDADAHRIHGDLHAGNLLVRDGVLHVLDFDDMMVGPAAQDVWLLFSGRDPDTRCASAPIFLDGLRGAALLRLREPAPCVEPCARAAHGCTTRPGACAALAGSHLPAHLRALRDGGVLGTSRRRTWRICSR